MKRQGAHVVRESRGASCYTYLYLTEDCTDLPWLFFFVFFFYHEITEISTHLSEAAHAGLVHFDVG